MEQWSRRRQPPTRATFAALQATPASTPDASATIPDLLSPSLVHIYSPRGLVLLALDTLLMGFVRVCDHLHGLIQNRASGKILFFGMIGNVLEERIN